MQFYCQTIVFGHFINWRDLRNRYSSRACPRNINMEKKLHRTPGYKLGPHKERMCFSHPSLFLHHACRHKETIPQVGWYCLQSGSETRPSSLTRLFKIPAVFLSWVTSIKVWGSWLPPTPTKREGWKGMTVVCGCPLRRGGTCIHRHGGSAGDKSSQHVRNGAVPSLRGCAFQVHLSPASNAPDWLV